MQPIFITGIGTAIGKTLVAAVLTEALEADYWKPVQAGYSDGTDSDWVQKVMSNSLSKVHPETYRLRLAASPHIAAREEGIKIDLEGITAQYERIKDRMMKDNKARHLIIEGAGGILVPLNEEELVVDLIRKLDAKVILVSRNYLGSINHSLLTARLCKSKNISVAGWIFNDQYLDYEEEIANWSGYPKIFSIPFLADLQKRNIAEQANAIRPMIKKILS